MNPPVSRLIFAVFCSCLALTVMAQKKTLPGIVRDKVSQQPVGMASVRNVNNGTTVVSKLNGNFIADVNAGNILAFSANGYYTDTLTINSDILASGKIFVELTPLPSTLQNVTVFGNYNSYQVDSIERRKLFLENVGENKIPPVGHTNDMGFGIAVNIDHFSKREKKKRHARTLFELLEEEAYINYRWNDTLVVKYTDFTGDRLSDFMQEYRPEYEWLRKNPTEEDMKYYINSKLKKMKKGETG